MTTNTFPDYIKCNQHGCIDIEATVEVINSANDALTDLGES